MMAVVLSDAIGSKPPPTFESIHKSSVGGGLLPMGPLQSTQGSSKKPPPNRLRIGDAVGWAEACFMTRLLRDSFHRNTSLNRCRAPVDIFEALDVVLTQIAA